MTKDQRAQRAQVIQADNVAASELTAALEEQGIALDQGAWRLIVQAFARHRTAFSDAERVGEGNCPHCRGVGDIGDGDHSCMLCGGSGKLNRRSGESGIDVESAAWDWMNATYVTDERSDDPVDRAYAADEMVDAFHAGRDSFASLNQPAASVVEDIPAMAQFLCDRLDELDFSQGMRDFSNDYFGHVIPALSRLKGALAALPSTPVGEG